MNKNTEKSLEDFLSTQKTEEEIENEKKVVVKDRSGLIERLDRTLVTKDGRQLLREQY